MNEGGFGGYAIAKETYEWLLENLPKGKTILELGSGKGTVELTKHWKVYSIEHDKRWLKYAEKSHYIYAPIITYGTNKKYKWYARRIIKKHIPKEYDLLLVDGPNGYIGREGFLRNIGIFKMNIPVIIDDTQREKYVKICDYIVENYKKKATTIQGGNKQFTVLL